ncbi:MAG: SusC/RagA family TonB-linked outer membrane protein [Prevotella sp.]|nr:SusC/RagA family TonB-linked outer membrane protein [Prevotella sp.]MDY4039059.1 SusC/RagA family TonB-linked outer membrane protein [Prevotella sp.]
MKRTHLLMLLLVMCFVTLPLSAQNERISMTFSNERLSSALRRLEKVSNFKISFAYRDVEPYTVSGDLKNATLESALRFLLADKPLAYTIKGRMVDIRRAARTGRQPVGSAAREITGTVKDETGEPLPGATVTCIGGSGEDKNAATATDADGKFRMFVSGKASRLEISFVGFQQKIVSLTPASSYVVVMVPDSKNIQEVVVTGVVPKSKLSFTGSASQFSGEELKSIGVQNPIASLKALDATFNVLDNSLYGSDPNHLPDINIRGKSSILGIKDEAANDPNQPLFIVDGFESTLETVYNMDISRIASMTILKDAASTAIYGSKAANGVVVVETVKPQAGKLRLSYNGSVAVSTPDLSSYNLMNASEKLMFEKLAGRYSTNSGNWNVDREILLSDVYNQRLADVQSGVDTYWLSAPLRTGINHKHNVYAEGGQGGFLFGIGLNYNGIKGVMKASKRNVYGGSIDLTYRLNKLQFQNQFEASKTEINDPIVPFSTYAGANPYYRKTDSEGNISRWLEYSDFTHAANPLYNASLNSRNQSSGLYLKNYFIIEYMPVENLKLRGKIGITHRTADKEVFVSPQSTTFESLDATKRGSFTATNSKSTMFNGEFTAIYAKMIRAHRFTVATGGTASEEKALNQGYSAVGFPEGNYTYPSFSNGYPDNGTPRYYETVFRTTSFYGTVNYAYDQRYLLDLNYRLSGSSVFGANKRFINTWSVGLGWNLMNEKFFKQHIHGVSMLKLRASIGNPGNQDFNSAEALTTYRFLYNSFNYFGTSTVLQQLGNPDLKWQTTLDRNYGLDLTMLHDRLSLTFDYYKKTTDPLLINIGVPPSTGVTNWYTNLGKQKAKGYSATAIYYIFRNINRRLIWSVRATLRHDDIKLDGISGHLDDLNNMGKARDTKRYYDGADPDAIWAVQSKGIDPSNGKELFVKKDGTYTYDFTYDDEVIVGNSRSKLEGFFSSNFTYKGFTLGATFGYKFGGKAFNGVLYNKVENISGDMLNFNQDRRALYDRWQQPGDIAKFKNIASSANTPMSSRFVQKNNSFTLTSLQLGYDFYQIAHKLGVQALRLSAYMNDLFWLTSIKMERGTAYPYARNFTLALSFTL